MVETLLMLRRRRQEAGALGLGGEVRSWRRSLIRSENNSGRRCDDFMAGAEGGISHAALIHGCCLDDRIDRRRRSDSCMMVVEKNGG